MLCHSGRVPSHTAEYPAVGSNKMADEEISEVGPLLNLKQWLEVYVITMVTTVNRVKIWPGGGQGAGLQWPKSVL